MNFEAEACRPTDRPAALAILFQHLSEFDRNRQVERLLRSPTDGGGNPVKLEGLLACRSPTGVVGAMLCVPSPGRVLMAWPPRALDAAGATAKEQIFTQLLNASVRVGTRGDCRFIQMLADEVSKELGYALATTGYTHLTRLLYVRRQVGSKESLAAPAAGIEFLPYSDKLRDEMSCVLERSYQGSLDCPELNGVRSMDDVFASHRGQGTFDPANWYLVRQRNRWIGCLLLTEVGMEKTIELTYVAVLPEARGRGLGAELTRQAVRHAQNRDFDAVVLAVDSRNHPALAMYEAEGFLPWDAKEIYLRLVNPVQGSRLT